MEYDYKIKKIDDTSVELLGEPKLSQWEYTVKLGEKWHNVFIDNNIVKFKRDINYYFNKIDIQPEQKDDEGNVIPKVYKCTVSIDLHELKKLQKIDNQVSGGSSNNDEKIKKIEEELKLKTKQINLLSSKIDNLENQIKKTFGL